MSNYKKQFWDKFWSDKLTLPTLMSTSGSIVMILCVPKELEWMRYPIGALLAVQVFSLLSCYISSLVVRESMEGYIKALENLIAHKDKLIQSYEREVQIRKELQQLTEQAVKDVK